MKSRKSRQQIRNLSRKAESPPPPPVAPAAVYIQQVRCVCGQILRLSTAFQGKRCSCPTCQRKFVISVTSDPKFGELMIAPVYVDDKLTTGGTFMAEPSNTDAVPEQIQVTCMCGARLPAKKAMYDKRVRCPKCSVRLLLTLKRSGQGNYSIHPLLLDDAPSGDTVVPEDDE